MWRLKSCPRCKGDMVLGNKDKHGWYEQCLQCGYIHDLQTFPIIKSEETGDERELIVTHHVSEKGLGGVLRDSARLREGSHRTALTDEMDFHLILDTLHKRHREDRQ